jgi:transketolase
MRVTFGEELSRLARDDERVVFIGSDLGNGAMEDFRRQHPRRFFMEGISEQHVMGMAAGLAMDGFVPFVASIASFITRRCYEQIRIDVCLHDLPVRIVGIGGGLTYAALGPTHTAVDDWALLRAIPNMTVLAPGDRADVRSLLSQSLALPGPAYLRLGPAQPDPLPAAAPATVGKATLLRPAREVLLVATGAMTAVALAAAGDLARRGIGAGVLHVTTLKPFDRHALVEAMTGCTLAVSLEEHSVVGGLGSAVADALADQGPGAGLALLRLGIPDTFPTGAHRRDRLLREYGLDRAGVARSVAARLEGRDLASPGVSAGGLHTGQATASPLGIDVGSDPNARREGAKT